MNDDISGALRFLIWFAFCSLIGALLAVYCAAGTPENNSRETRNAFGEIVGETNAEGVAL